MPSEVGRHQGRWSFHPSASPAETNRDIIGVPGWAPIFGTRHDLLVAQLCKETLLYALAHLSCRSHNWIYDFPWSTGWVPAQVIEA